MSLIIQNPYHWPITLTDATPTADGIMSAADKAKLDSTAPLLTARAQTIDLVPVDILTISPDDLTVTLMNIFTIMARIRGGANDNKGAYYIVVPGPPMFRRDGGILTSTSAFVNPNTQTPRGGSDVALNGTTLVSSFSGTNYVMTATGLAGEVIDWMFLYTNLVLPA